MENFQERTANISFNHLVCISFPPSTIKCSKQILWVEIHMHAHLLPKRVLNGARCAVL